MPSDIRPDKLGPACALCFLPHRVVFTVFVAFDNSFAHCFGILILQDTPTQSPFTFGVNNDADAHYGSTYGHL